MRALVPYFKAGLNARQASDRTGICTKTTQRYYRKFTTLYPNQKHTCGRHLQHRGRCWIKRKTES